ncbi:hypothetical protein ACFO9Q_10925 [Paenibacillus sp. GCM10023252]|uniref:hypothetical protein n=1 Tax=Paenibacillus sp. GCM10023252 TaxID=3252649 RepID=UPI00360D02B9
MNNNRGSTIVAFTLLTTAVIITLGQLGVNIDEIDGSYNNNWFDQIPFLAWILLIISLIYGLVLINKNKD